MKKITSEKTLVFTFQKNMKKKEYKMIIKPNSLIILMSNPTMSIPTMKIL